MCVDVSVDSIMVVVLTLYVVLVVYVVCMVFYDDNLEHDFY